MLKGNAPSPGRKFNPSAKRRADYSAATKKILAEKASKRERKPYAVGTVVSVLSLLRRIASFGADRRLCDGLSFKVKTPKGAKQKTEDMTGDQIARYIRTCQEWPDPQEGNYQLLALYTGMRRSEVRKLKWADVDLDRGFILLRDPKSGEDQRVPLGDAAIGVLKSHQRVQHVTPDSDAAAALLEAGFHSASSLTQSQYVFTGEKGGPRGLRQIGESSRSIRDAAGLPADFRPIHGLRHTFASHLASSGEVDLYTLQRLMTHKSPIMTQRYAHLRDETLKRGANVMSRIVREANEKAREKGRDGIA
jgi:integrase